MTPTPSPKLAPAFSPKRRSPSPTPSTGERPPAKPRARLRVTITPQMMAELFNGQDVVSWGGSPTEADITLSPPGPQAVLPAAGPAPPMAAPTTPPAQRAKTTPPTTAAPPPPPPRRSRRTRRTRTTPPPPPHHAPSMAALQHEWMLHGPPAPVQPRFAYPPMPASPPAPRVPSPRAPRPRAAPVRPDVHKPAFVYQPVGQHPHLNFQGSPPLLFQLIQWRAVAQVPPHAAPPPQTQVPPVPPQPPAHYRYQPNIEHHRPWQM